MVNTPKRPGDGVIVENPDKRTISEGNKEVRKQKQGEADDSHDDEAGASE